MSRLVAALILCLAAATARAAAAPAVTEIVFEGNKTTQEKVMLREMVIHVGDPADAEQIERSRQYIQDLGLFRRVEVRQQEVHGGVRLVYTVDEKWYILPYPRLSANVDGQTSAGAEVRWNNIAGLNHSLRVVGSRSNLKEPGRGKQTNYTAQYSAPFVFDSPYRVNANLGHTISPVTGDLNYDETFNNAGLSVSRTFPDADGAASQGTSWGGGVGWQRESTSGNGAPAPYGQAVSLNASYGYTNQRFNIFSEEGVNYGIGVAAARKGVASDYSFETLTGSYRRILHVGETEHQTLLWQFSGGVFGDGPDGVKAFSLGGSKQLRGYKVNSLQGNAYYLAQAEFFRPVFLPSLRLGAILEAGNVYGHPRDANFGTLRTSLGFALRLRLTRFVNFEFEVGYAFPLNGGQGKFFGGRV